MSALPVVRACAIDAVALEQRWLVEELWGLGDVGILGGEPKSYKSFLALQIAVAVASGSPCLGRFQVPSPGRVLVFAAEDALHTVRCRLDGICHQVGADLDDLDLWVITAPVVRLDRQEDRRALHETIESLQPKLLILDPFVRLHRVDENASAAVAPLLAALRHLQRTHGCAILVVHHARKSGAARAGQALRGTSEFHAWGDVTVFLQRMRVGVRLSVEQRAGRGIDGLWLKLRDGERGPALAVAEPEEEDEPSETVEDRVLAVFQGAEAPLSSRQVRARCKVRMATLLTTLGQLTSNGRLERTERGWRLGASVTADPQSSTGSGNGKQMEGAA
jgi:hypothetical protein